MLIGTYNAQYIGETMCGFIKDNEYCINIDKDVYGYQVSGIINLTDEEETNAFITYASEKSLRTYWIIQKDITELNK